MIIGEPNDFVAEVHDRMPVLLMPSQLERWLSGSMGVEELRAAPNDYLQRWPVSKRVSSSKADKEGATLIEPLGEEREDAIVIRACPKFAFSDRRVSAPHLSGSQDWIVREG